MNRERQVDSKTTIINARDSIISNHLKFRSAVTEIWDFKNGSSKKISPTLESLEYGYGIALYPVPINFCLKP